MNLKKKRERERERQNPKQTPCGAHSHDPEAMT